MDLSPLSGTHHGYRIPDGDVVLPDLAPAPAPTGPPVTRRQLIYGWICAGILAAGPIIAVARVLWP